MAAFAFLTLTVTVSAGAQASDEADELLRREEFALARDRALAQVASGEREATELVPLYRVLAIALGLLDDAEASRQAFVWLLALKPEFRLGDQWPVKARSPYMEARGAVSTHTDVLSADGRLAEDKRAWLVHVSDPFHLAARVRLRARFVGEGEYVENVRMPASEVSFPLPENPQDRALEYSISLLDEYGNRVWQAGSDRAPLVHAYRAPSALVSASSASALQRTQRSEWRPRGYKIGATTALIVAGAAALVGGIQHAERQRLAKRWNDGACDGSGATRGDVCREVRQSIDQAQRAAGAAYAISGVSLLTSLLLFIGAPSSAQEESERPVELAQRVRCAGGPGKWGLSCATSF